MHIEVAQVWQQVAEVDLVSERVLEFSQQVRTQPISFLKAAILSDCC